MRDAPALRALVARAATVITIPKPVGVSGLPENL
jgi:hypothetical protein